MSRKLTCVISGRRSISCKARPTWFQISQWFLRLSSLYCSWGYSKSTRSKLMRSRRHSLTCKSCKESNAFWLCQWPFRSITGARWSSLDAQPLWFSLSRQLPLSSSSSPIRMKYSRVVSPSSYGCLPLYLPSMFLSLSYLSLYLHQEDRISAL